MIVFCPVAMVVVPLTIIEGVVIFITETAIILLDVVAGDAHTKWLVIITFICVPFERADAE